MSHFEQGEHSNWGRAGYPRTSSMANCFTKRNGYPRYLSKKDYQWFDSEFYHQGGVCMRYGPDHPKEKIVSFDMTLLLETMSPRNIVYTCILYMLYNVYILYIIQYRRWQYTACMSGFSNTHYVIQINPAKSTTSKYLFPKRHTCLPFERVSNKMKKISIFNFERWRMSRCCRACNQTNNRLHLQSGLSVACVPWRYI